jgi:hypothetical protein
MLTILFRRGFCRYSSTDRLALTSVQVELPDVSLMALFCIASALVSSAFVIILAFDDGAAVRPASGRGCGFGPTVNEHLPRRVGQPDMARGHIGQTQQHVGLWYWSLGDGQFHIADLLATDA